MPVCALSGGSEFSGLDRVQSKPISDIDSTFDHVPDPCRFPPVVPDTVHCPRLLFGRSFSLWIYFYFYCLLAVIVCVKNVWTVRIHRLRGWTDTACALRCVLWIFVVAIMASALAQQRLVGASSLWEQKNTTTKQKSQARLEGFDLRGRYALARTGKRRTD